MHTRNVGNTGLRVSSIGFGCNNFGLKTDLTASTKLVHNALDAGVTLFDTAPVYGAEWGQSESILGKALGRRRQDAVIVTKFGMCPDYSRNTSRSNILKQVDESLGRLGTDYIDIYMLHWPDVSTPMEETLRALDDLVTSGKVRYLGCGNLPAWQVVESQWLSKNEGLHRYIVTQEEYSLVGQQNRQSHIPALEKYGMALMPYSPLANGLLTGKYSASGELPSDTRLAKNLWNMGDRYLTPERLQLVDKLSAFAQERGHNLLELAISWLLAQPVVCSVIAGTTTPQQLQKNLECGEWKLAAEEMQQIDQICQG
ncbi:aldo/keto reductase [Pseudomaricurvus sp. HS19]|uniref:aldo/keto reductase n=1 Tax=Pseudomaricurvus sp. HS19 TaxID=2692626 RepID=UPI001370F737|nr:aldo/keto reductase [Pseudomaricurvus sp. HS19]MYM63939.1 aldo/keto reductase [Pseudomaricurvus sp. HS19]